MKVFPCLVFLLFFLPSAFAGEWREVEPGFSHLRLMEPSVHLIRVDPSKWRLEVLRAKPESGKDYGQAALAARRYRERSGAVLVQNGGFFDERFGSLGLLVQKGKVVSPLRKASWGVFYLAGGVPMIVGPKEYHESMSVEMAIQAGPRLVVGGKTLKVKESLPARRSAIGITGQKEILLALCETPILLKDWAELLRKYADHVLNLDGGGSSQLSVKLKDFALQVSGETGVPNALAIFAK